MQTILAVVSLLLTSTVSLGAEPITRDDLLSGCKVPERREFAPNGAIPACQDFYQHVCSKTIDSFDLPKEKSGWNFAFNDLSERLLYARKNYLKRLGAFIPESDRGKALRTFYLACMNDKAGADDERSYVGKTMNALSELKSREAFVAYVADQIDKPRFSFFNYASFPDQDDPTLSALLLYVEAATMPEKSYYEKKANVTALETMITDFFKTLGFKDAPKRAKRVAQFEVQMAKHDLTPAEYRERQGSRNTVERAKLLEEYPEFALRGFFTKIPNKLAIRVIAPEPMRFFHSALKTESLDTLKDAYLYHSLRGKMDDGYPEFFSSWFSFSHKILGGPEKRRPRDERCAEELDNRFAKELDTELLAILFKDFPEKKVREVAENVRNSLLEQFEENTWLTPPAKKEAINKIKKAKLFLVKPRSEKEWDYNPIGEYSETTPVQNRIKLHELMIAKDLKELAGARNREKWLMGPLTLNAYYVPMDNQFTLLQGILQFPFFDPSRSQIENLGAIGSVTGHELGHGVDDQGSRYDAEGKFRNWMSEKDLADFKYRGARFIDQFNKIGHDGKLTLGENIGDHVGLRSAFRAAFGAKGKGSVEDKRKFFVAYSQVWCQKMLPGFRERLLKTDPHALGFARVNEQVVHVDGFYEAFGCKKGDKMFLEPEARLKFW